MTSNSYWDWHRARAIIFAPMQGIIGECLGTVKEFPPSQKAGSFNLDKVMETMTSVASGGA